MLSHSCNPGGSVINLLCFADNMVLLAPSWDRLLFLIDIVFTLVQDINMTFNTTKSVCMMFNPTVSCKIVS